MAIKTKTGDLVTDIRIDPECYYLESLIKVWGSVNGKSRLMYISDLRGDIEREVQYVVRAALKGSPQ